MVGAQPVHPIAPILGIPSCDPSKWVCILGESAVGAAWQAAGDEASWLWLFAFFVVITIGELYLSPIGLSLVSKVAPVRLVSMLMGMWLATSFIGNFLAGFLGSFWSTMDKVNFFLMIATVAERTCGKSGHVTRFISAMTPL